MTWILVLVLAVGAAAVFPAAASAHGRGVPVATDWRVELGFVPPGVEAVPVDGDRDLWLRVRPSATLTVLGAIGEPLLRFTDAGVFVNTRSPTAQSDGIVRTPGHGWRRVTSGHAYRWHEHRLHVLEPAGGGRFSVPLRLDGARTAIRGSLDRVRGGTAWPWLLVGLGALAAGLLVRPLRPAAVVATAAAATLRIGHALHGRPSVAASAIADVAVTALLAALLLWAAVAARSAHVRATAALVLGIGAVGEAVTMTPVLTHSLALNELGTTPSRVAVALAYACGILAAVFGFRILIREETP